MSAKRLNKRQLREQQELQELADVPLPNTSSSTIKFPFQLLDPTSQDEHTEVQDEQHHQDAPKAITKKPTSTSIFAALVDGTDQQEQDHQDQASQSEQDISVQQAAKSSKKKNKKKKKRAASAAAIIDYADGSGGGISGGCDGDGDDADTAAHPDAQARPPQPKLSSTKKSSKNKSASSAIQATSKAKLVSEMSIDEFDALLASQSSLNNIHSSNTNTRSASSGPSSAALNRVSAFRTHLSLDPRSLDPSIELRRQFGTAAIKAYQSEASSSSASSGARARAQTNNPNLKLRTLLCTPKEHWPPIARVFTGMSMDVVDSPTHGRICTWKHSKAYRQVQMQFLQAVRSYDPNSLVALLRVYPYHIDTLLQLSEYSRHQGDLGQAADFNDRALFALERCASPYLTSCLSSTTSGPPVVNFAKIESRAFYLAIHRNIGFLGRRGTWRTALEWSKLLLGLGGDGQDHHAALLWIDFLAIKSRQHRWLLDLIQRLDEQRSRANSNGTYGSSVSHVDQLSVPARTIFDDGHDKQNAGEDEGYSGSLDWCVGLAYSRALAFRAVEKEEGDKKSHIRSDSALRLAIARFPQVVPLLCNKVGVELPSKIATHAVFALEPRFSSSKDTLADLLTHVYVLRSESLWKESGYAEWLRSTVMSISDALIADYDLGDKKRKTQPASASKNTRQGIYRHILVSDVPDTVRQQLIAYLPPNLTASSEQMDSFDPVPPTDISDYSTLVSNEVERDVENVTRYNDEYFAPIMTDLPFTRGGGGGGGVRGTGTALEGGEGGGMMAAFRRALQGLGGLQGWDQAMGDMDDETREDVMAQVMQLVQGRDDGGMPGALDVDRYTEGLGDDDDDVATETGGGAFAAIRGAPDAIWGSGADDVQPIHRHDDDVDDDIEEQDQDEEEVGEGEHH